VKFPTVQSFFKNLSQDKMKAITYYWFKPHHKKLYFNLESNRDEQFSKYNNPLIKKGTKTIFLQDVKKDFELDN